MHRSSSHPADIKAKCQGGEAFAHTRGQSWSSSKCFHADEIFLSGLFFPYQVKMYLSLFLDSRSQTWLCPSLWHTHNSSTAFITLLLLFLDNWWEKIFHRILAFLPIWAKILTAFASNYLFKDVCMANCLSRQRECLPSRGKKAGFFPNALIPKKVTFTKLRLGKFTSSLLYNTGSFLSLGFLSFDINLLYTHLPGHFTLLPWNLVGVRKDSMRVWGSCHLLCTSCCCCSITKSCPTLSYPMDCSMPGIPVLHYLLDLLKLMAIDSVMSSNHLSLLPPSPLALHLSQPQGLFQCVDSSHQVAQVLELQHQSFQLIFRVDFL